MNNVTLVGSFNKSPTMGTTQKGDTSAFGLFRPVGDKNMFAVTALGKVADQMASILPEDIVAISGKLTSYQKDVKVYAFAITPIVNSAGGNQIPPEEAPKAATKAPRPAARPARPAGPRNPEDYRPAEDDRPPIDSDDI